MDIDKSKLGIVKYGMEIEGKLKEQYVGCKIIDVQYNYFAECFYLLLDNGESITLDI